MNSQNSYGRKINTFLCISRFTVEYLDTIEAKNYVQNLVLLVHYGVYFLENIFQKSINQHTYILYAYVYAYMYFIKYHNILNTNNKYII